MHKRAGLPNKVWLLDLSSGARRPWRDIAPPDLALGIPRLVITPDGATYVYGMQHVLSELYVIEGLR